VLLSLNYKLLIIHKNIKRVKKIYPSDRPRRTIGLRDVESPMFSLDNQFTVGGEVVSLMRRPPFIAQEDSWYSFMLEAESTKKKKNTHTHTHRATMRLEE
jgi:hypothetical protein